MRVVIHVALALVCGMSAAAQTAVVRGRALDALGQPIAGVHVVLSSSGRRVASTESSADGRFHLPVPPGDYVLTAHWGSQQLQRTRLRLAAGQTRRVQLKFSPTAEALARPGAGSAQKLAAHQVASLPLEERDSSKLLLLAAGTTTASGTGGNFTQQYSVHGQRGEASVFALDGADTTDPELGGATISDFNVDAIRSINSLSGVLPASVGEGAAGYVNVITKSGTKQFHGDLFEFLRNSAFDARNFFDRQSATAPGRIPRFRRNEFGGTLGGPLAERTYYFIEYQGLRQTLGTTQVLSVPSAAEREGLDTTAYAGDTLDVPVSPAIKPILARYPLPNDPSGPFGAQTFATSSDVTTRSDQYSLRLDRQWTRRSQLFARYTVENVLGPTTNPNQTALDPAFAQLFSEHYRSVALHYARILSPDFTSDTLVGFIRSTPVYASLDTSDPAMNFADGLFQSFNGLGGGFRGMWSNLFQFRQNFADQHGNHIFQFGGEVRFNRDTSIFTFSTDGSYTFGAGSVYAPVAIRSASGKHDISAGGLLPDTLSAFLTATPFQYSQSTAEPGFPQGNRQGEAAIHRAAYNGYFQDTWHVAPKLTLTSGLRYELDTPLTEAHDENSGPLFTEGGEQWLANPQPVWHTDWNGWGPRFSAAWQAGRTTLVHAGAGIVTILYYPNPDTGSFNGFPFAVETVATASRGVPVPFSPSVQTVALPLLYTPAGQRVYPPNSSYAAPNTPIDVDRFERQLAAQFPGGQVRPIQLYGQSPDFGNGYMATEVVGVEHRLRDYSLSANYVGVTGVHLIGNIFPNGYNGAAPGFAPYTQFDASGQVSGGFGEEILFSNPFHSSYNAGELGVRKAPGAAGLGFNASFTYSHAIDNQAGQGAPPQDPYEPGQERGNSNTDTPLDLSVSVAEQIPAAALPHPLGWLAAWQVEAIGQMSSGTPFSVVSGIEQTGWGNNSDNRPDQTGTPVLSTSRSVREDYFGRSAENARYFTVPIGIAGGSGPFQGRAGTLGRNTFRGPAYRDLDLAIFRTFGLGGKPERAHLELRGEAYNVLNEVNFASPNRVLTGAGFGLIDATRGNSRQLQLSAKVIF